MDTGTKFFSPHRFIIVLAILALGFALIACGGTSKKKSEPASSDDKSAESKGSLSRTFTIVDENGRASGTLTIDPVGGVLLRDENGAIVGKCRLDKSDQTQSTEAPPAAQSEEAKSKE